MQVRPLYANNKCRGCSQRNRPVGALLRMGNVATKKIYREALREYNKTPENAHRRLLKALFPDVRSHDWYMVNE